MPRLTLEHCERAVSVIQMGATRAFIAKTCSRVAVTDLMQRYRQTGQTPGRPRTGRPRVPSPHEDRNLRILYLRNRFLAATSSPTGPYLSIRLSRLKPRIPSYQLFGCYIFTLNYYYYLAETLLPAPEMGPHDALKA